MAIPSRSDGSRCRRASGRPPRRARPPGPSLLALVSEPLQEIDVLDFDPACAERFERVQGGLLRKGTSVASMDLMSAFVALVHDLTLVAHNTADYQSVPDLRPADWLAP